jgi:hypothetical protein
MKLTQNGKGNRRRNWMTDLINRVRAIVERSYSAEGGFAPLLVLDGPNGSAVLRLDRTDHALPPEKARLMALALRADSCILAVDSTLCFSGGVTRHVIALLSKGREGCGITLFAPRRRGGHVELGHVRTPMTGSLPDDVLDRFVHDIFPKSTQGGTVDQAWGSLEKMGVTIARIGRQLH